MKITIRPLTLSLWPDLEALFGRSGASNGCWCMYWRIGPEYHKRPREKNRIAFRKIVKHGPPPELLAFPICLAMTTPALWRLSVLLLIAAALWLLLE